MCISCFFVCPKNFFFTLLYWYAAYTPPPSKINAWLPPCLIRRSAMDLSISDVEKWMGSMLGEHKKVRCYFLSLRVISFLMLYTPHKNLLFHQIECLKRCGEQGRLICTGSGQFWPSKHLCIECNILWVDVFTANGASSMQTIESYPPFNGLDCCGRCVGP